MQELFESPYKRRLFFFIAAATLAVLLGVRIFTVRYLPSDQAAPPSILITILDALLSTSFATIAIACLIYWLSPPIMHRTHIRLVEPNDINSALADARKGAAEWWYSGGAGRFTRAVTLPEFAKAATSENASKKVVVQILDPTNDVSCRNYVEYRNSLRSAAENRWSVNSLQEELYATIVAAYCWRVIQTRLDVTVALKREFSVFRTDLSNTRAVVTKEDKREPAILCEARSVYYDSYSEDVRLGLKQARKLPVVDIAVSSLDELNPVATAELLTSLGIFNDGLTTERLEKVVRLVKDQKDPYA